MTNPHRTTGRTNQRHVRQPDRPLLLGDSAFNVALRIRTHVFLHRHHVLHQHLAFVGKHAQHAPFLSRILARHHLHRIVAADVHSLMFGSRCCSHTPSFRISFCRDGACPVSARALKHFRRQRHNLQKFLLAQFASHRTEYARPYRLAGFINQHRRILIEADVRPIPPPVLFPRPHDDRLYHFALLYLTVGRSLFHAGRDHVAQTRVQTGRTAERHDHLQLARAGIIGDLDHRSHHQGHDCLLLSTRCLADRYFEETPVTASTSTTSGTRAVLRTISFSVQRFSFDSGRDSSIFTTSPAWLSFFSSCA